MYPFPRQAVCCGPFIWQFLQYIFLNLPAYTITKDTILIESNIVLCIHIEFNYTLLFDYLFLQVIIGQGCYRGNVYDLDFGTHAFHCESMQIGVGVAAGILFLLLAASVVVYLKICRSPPGPKLIGFVQFPVKPAYPPLSSYLNSQQQPPRSPPLSSYLNSQQQQVQLLSVFIVQ